MFVLPVASFSVVMWSLVLDLLQLAIHQSVLSVSKLQKQMMLVFPVLHARRIFIMSLGPDFDSSGHCHMSSSDNNMSLDDLSEDEIDLPLKLQEIVNNRGLKLIHQNI